MDVNPDAVVEIEDAKAAHSANLKLSEGKVYKLLMVSPKFFNPNQEVMRYLSSEEVTQFRKAAAIVTGNMAIRILMNFFIRMNSKKSPVRLFRTEELALEWLRSIDL
jgi:hypothetical protein